MSAQGGSEAAGGLAPAAGSGSGTPEPATDLRPVLNVLEKLAERLGDLEDAVAEAVEELEKTRRAISDLKKSAATKKQVKKLKKALDQLEVIEVGPDDAPAEAGRRDSENG